MLHQGLSLTVNATVTASVRDGWGSFMLHLKRSSLSTLKQDFCHQENKSGMLGGGDVQMIVEYSMWHSISLLH